MWRGYGSCRLGCVELCMRRNKGKARGNKAEKEGFLHRLFSSPSRPSHTFSLTSFSQDNIDSVAFSAPVSY